MRDLAPPHSLKAELSVLSAILTYPEALDVVLETLTEDSFYRTDHKALFRSAARLATKGSTVDALTVAEDLQAAGELDDAGGVEGVGRVLEVVAPLRSVGDHAAIVRDKAELRRLLHAARTIEADVYEQGDRSVSDIVAAAESAVLQLGQSKDGDYVAVGSLIGETLDAIEALQNGEATPRVKTGIKALDAMVLGLEKQDLCVIAARPSMGKTALALGIAIDAALSQQIPTLVFSFEMSRQSLMLRAISHEARVDAKAIRGGLTLTPEDHERIGTAAGQLNGARLFIDDSYDSHIAPVSSRIRRAVAKEGVGLVVIDYLQLMQAPGDSRVLQIGAITRALKILAKQCDIPIILLSQLNRGPEGRSDKRPLLSDLRESGDIEQDADQVWMLYRPAYYLSDEEKEGPVAGGRSLGMSEVLVRKNRNGETGKVPVFFHDVYARFEDLGARA